MGGRLDRKTPLLRTCCEMDHCERSFVPLAGVPVQKEGASA